MTDQKEFYTVMEFAEKTSLHPNTIRRMIKEGRLQAFRTSNTSKSSHRIPITEVSRICELDMSKLIERIVEKKLEERNVQR